MMGFRFEMDIMHAECESFRVPAVLVSLNADYSAIAIRYSTG